MTFEVGRLSAALTLEGVDQFHRDLDGAGKALQQTGQRGASFGKAGEAAVRAAAGATTGLVSAAGAYLTILTKTGVGYNSLQQNSRAALSVVLGGAEKANQQMAKLDEFARTSPFSKQVFIQAQQQLLGFGLEAEKVVPTLDAIQQGVAAVGGSNDDIQEIVRILAQVQSTGEFTGVTLRQLGIRGVDAAELIGQRMGKTGQEIRDALSSGALDGREAMDLLVEAMDDSFGGAADRVKQQWSGAVDRIKAANRDLGSVIAEPFVSAEGGGMAVTWGNQVADVLRAIEAQAVPVMEILTRRGMPFFSSLTQGLDTTQQAIQRWDASKLDGALDRLSDHAPGIAATAGAVLALGAQVGPLGRLLSTLGISANPAVAAFVGLAAASPELRDGLKQILDAGKPLLPVVGDLAKAFSGQLNAAIPLVASGAEVLASVLGVAASIIEKIPTPVLAGAAAFLVLHRGLRTVEGPLQAVTDAFVRFGQRSQVQAALGGTSLEMGALSAASIRAQGAVKGLGTALKTAFLSNPVGIALTVISTAVAAWAMANAKAQQQVEEHTNRVASLKDTLNETTGALTEASAAQVEANLAETEAQALAEKIGVSYRDVQEAVLGNEEAYSRVTDAVEKYADSMTTGDKNADTWNKTFMDGQATVKEFSEILEEHRASVEAAQEAKRQMIQEDREAAAALTEAARSNKRFNEALQVARDVTQDTETRVRALRQALDELKGGSISAEEAQIRLTRTSESLADVLARTDEEGNKLWTSLINSEGAIDANVGAGADLAEMMQRASFEMNEAALSASDVALANGDVAGAVDAATAAGDRYIERLRETMAEAGLTEAQIEGLIGTYLDVPSMVATLITDNGTISEVDQRALALITQLNGVPEGKTITVKDPGNPAVIKRMEDLGYTIENTADGKHITVTQQGAEGVKNAIQDILNLSGSAVRIAVGMGGGGGITKADGGVVGHTPSGVKDMQAFVNGGFPTGVYRGGPPLIKFAEPETGWEAFISGRPGQEKRNAKIAMDALDRLGFPVVPVSALRGVPAFADGGMVSRSSPTTQSRPTSPERVHVRRKRNAPLAEVINVGVEAQTNDLRKLAQFMDRLDREG